MTRDRDRQEQKGRDRPVDDPFSKPHRTSAKTARRRRRCGRRWPPRPAGSGVRPNRVGNGKPETAEEAQGGAPAEQPVPLTESQSQRARLQELLRQVGLDSLRPPPNGILSRQWLDFLEQLKSATGSPGSRKFRGVKRPVNPFLGGETTSLPTRPRSPEPKPELRKAPITPGDYEGTPGSNTSRDRADGEGLDNRAVADRSITKDERERALLALMKEGHRMPPSKAALIAKVAQMRKKGDGERSGTSK